MELSQKDQEKLEVLHQASNTLKRLPAGSTYPVRELQWLITHGWNRGAIHVKFDRLEDAANFMAAAVNLNPYCPAMKDQMKVGGRHLLGAQAAEML